LEPVLRDRLFNDVFVNQNIVTTRRKTTHVHYHNFYEIYYQLEGYTKHFLGDKIFVSKKDMLVFIPPYAHHSTDSESCSKCSRILIQFKTNYLPEEVKPLVGLLSDAKFIYIPPNSAQKIEEIAFRLKKEYEKNEEYSDYIIKFCLAEFIAVLCRLKCDFPPSQADSAEVIYNISSYIRKHYDSDLSLEFLSKKFFINKDYLSKKFRNVSGIGINQFITYVRIKNAEELLRNTTLSINEIAHSVGYKDSNYFSKVFKEINNISPHAFAKLRSSKEETV